MKDISFLYFWILSISALSACNQVTMSSGGTSASNNTPPALPPSSGASYYVDTNGSDTSGNGSQTSPWKSLSYACSKVTAAGSTIYIDAGNYTDNASCNLAIGVNIQGAGVRTTTITSAYGGAYGTGYIQSKMSATNPVTHGSNEISGFTLDGSNKTLSAGIYIANTDEINIHHMAFQNIHSHAISLTGWDSYGATSAGGPNVAPTAYGLNDVVHDVTITNCTSDTTLSTDDRYGAINLMTLRNLQIYNVNINETQQNCGTGIKAANGWLYNAQIHDSTILMSTANTNSFVFETYNFLGNSGIYNNRFNQYISLNGGLTALANGSAWNLQIYNNTFDLTGVARTTTGNEFSHNWLNVYGNYFFGSGTAAAAGLWTTNYATASGVAHWQFNNNVVYNFGNGVFINSGANSDIRILNNVFDTITGTPYGGSGVYTAGGSATGMRIQNNLFINNQTPIYVSSSYPGVVESNNWLNAANPGISGAGTGNATRPAPYYVPSSASSNLVNAGTNVGLAFLGSAPDIGAYEYGSSATVGAGPSAPSP